MSYQFRPAQRVNTPIIVGLAGPSKSGKTFSALRIAVGLSEGGKIAMINTEGPRGHQYASEFHYDACDVSEPFAMKRYEESIKAAIELRPSVLIIDSMSHAHEGIGGMLDQHETELDRMAGKEYQKRERMTWAAWVKPKKDEADMINSMLQVPFHIVLCFRAKEKVKIVRGQPPVDLGWRPIASDRIHFETAFTIILPPNSKGTPDLSSTGSELRSPFDTMITGKQLDEALGKRLAEWSRGGVSPPAPVSASVENAAPDEKPKLATPGQVQQIQIIMKKRGFKDRDKALEDFTSFCGRQIKSSNEMTFDEAHDFIEANINEAQAA